MNWTDNKYHLYLHETKFAKYHHTFKTPYISKTVEYFVCSVLSQKIVRNTYISKLAK